MSPTNPLPPVLCLMAALGAAFLLVKRCGNPPAQGRYVSIDGLRGLLAFSVVMHHASIWYMFLHTGEWYPPKSTFYTFLGEGSVSMFFMITGFLFFSKLIDGRKKKFDWVRLYVSRVMRLTPLYLFAMVLLFLIVALRSNGVLREPLPQLIENVGRYLSFTILGSPLLNGVPETGKIMAGVYWTLAYEWFFYLSLPLLCLLTGKIPPFVCFVFGLLGMGFLWLMVRLDGMYGLDLFYPEFWKVAPFVGGMAAAVLARSQRFRKLAGSWICSLIVIGCLVAVSRHHTIYYGKPIWILSAAFALIACGNDLFGILTRPVFRMLGEISYSVYLLHGIFLYVTFTFLLGERAESLPLWMHWLVVFCLTPSIIFGSFATFRLIEKPGIDETPAATSWAQRKIQPILDFGQKTKERIYSRGKPIPVPVLKDPSQK